MFDLIRAYKNLKKANKFLRGVKIMAEISNDKEMLSTAKMLLDMNENLKRKLIFKPFLSRKIAKNYNDAFGFVFDVKES